MQKLAFLAPVAVSAFFLASSVASAAPYTYVGSWQVDDGVFWGEQPLAYSGQEAAALLFGGVASDYAISTVSTLADAINFKAWYSILGVSGGFELPQDLDQALPSGLYYDGSDYVFDLMTNPASAFVDDNAVGAAFTNYAFRVSEVPLPATGLLLFAAVVGIAGLSRRKTTAL